MLEKAKISMMGYMIILLTAQTAKVMTSKEIFHLLREHTCSHKQDVNRNTDGKGHCNEV